MSTPSAWPYLKEIEGKRLLDASRLWQYHSLRRAEIEVNLIAIGNAPIVRAQL